MTLSPKFHEFYDQIQFTPDERELRRRWRAKSKALAKLYFIGPEDMSVGRVKIGITSGTVATRLKALQTGSPFPLTIYAFREAFPSWEELFHLYFADERLHGEWFHLDGELGAGLRRALEVCDGDPGNIGGDIWIDALFGRLVMWADDYPNKERRARLMKVLEASAR